MKIIKYYLFFIIFYVWIFISFCLFSTFYLLFILMLPFSNTIDFINKYIRENKIFRKKVCKVCGVTYLLRRPLKHNHELNFYCGRINCLCDFKGVDYIIKKCKSLDKKFFFFSKKNYKTYCRKCKKVKDFNDKKAVPLKCLNCSSMEEKTNGY